jgi:hypothetical protein
MRMIIIIGLLIIGLLVLTACEERSDIIFSNAQKECSQNGTYCHLFRTNAETVNLTFNMTGNLTYEVAN